MDSRSSSLYTSSGSEESMGVKHYRSVSRNSSNASHKFNGTELMNINEHQCEVTQPIPPFVAKENRDQPKKEEVVSTAKLPIEETQPAVLSPTTCTTLKNNKRKNLKSNYHQQMVDGRRTVQMMMGGRGYINWRHVWYSNSPSVNGSVGVSNGSVGATNGDKQPYHLRSNSVTITHKLPNSMDGHIIIWEKKL